APGCRRPSRETLASRDNPWVDYHYQGRRSSNPHRGVGPRFSSTGFYPECSARQVPVPTSSPRRRSTPDRILNVRPHGMGVRLPRVPPPTLPKDPVCFGGHPSRATLCLRVCGDSLDPEEVTRLLGRAPTRSQRKGQPVLSASGETKRIARTGSWLLDQPVRGDVTIEEEIE